MKVNSKKILKSDQGQTNLLMCLFLFSISLLSFYTMLKLKQNNIIIKERLQSYLCFKKQIENFKSYIRTINAQNISIGTLYITSKTPPPAGPSAAALLNLVKLAQQATHLAYMAKSQTISYCKGYQKLAVASALSPYKTTYGIYLKRDSIGKTIYRKTSWTFYIPSKSSQKPLLESFLLKAKFKTKSPINLKLSYETKESGIGEWSKLKLPFI